MKVMLFSADYFSVAEIKQSVIFVHNGISVLDSGRARKQVTFDVNY